MDAAGNKHNGPAPAGANAEWTQTSFLLPIDGGKDQDPDELIPDGIVLSTFKRVRLGGLISKGIQPPEFMCDVLYRAGLHSIAGPPDCGKTTIALYWITEMIRAGETVLFLDEEGGEEIISEKLLALGASPDEVDEYLVYLPFPARQWTDSDVRDLQVVAVEYQPAMVLCDSSAAFLARAGLDENSAADVTGWWERVLTPLARVHKAAVVVIDHDSKATEQSRYARGSGAKLAACDVQFKCELVTPFTREQDGELKITITKDRRGWLHRDWKVNVKTGGGLIIPEFIRAEGVTPSVTEPRNILIAAGVTADDSVRTAATKIRGAGFGMTQAVISENLKKLKEVRSVTALP